MRHVPVWLSLLIGCGEEPFNPPNDVPAGDTAPLAVPTRNQGLDEHFATSDVCAQCHSNAPAADAMRDNADNPIGMYDLWQGTMMANAARDPFFRTTVAVEMAEYPNAAGALNEKCARCHLPMAVTDAALHDVPNTGLQLTNATGDIAQFARDGVSCTTCHQIEPGNLNTPESFTGGFEIAAELKIYGPYQNPIAGPMIAHSGFNPVYGAHIRDSGLCATCHTLYSTPFDDDGVPLGPVFPEQTPYLEWKAGASDEDGHTCQSCHVPQLDEDGDDIKTRIARSPPGGDFNMGSRTPYGRHLFVGGNTWIPAMIRDNRDLLHPAGTTDAFDATIAAARDNLARAATVGIANASLDGNHLVADITVHADAGHKFPTGYPSRRAWLHVLILDKDGQVVFESGGYDGLGRLIDGDGEVLPSEWRGGPILPHLDEITAADQVVSYEPIPAGADGEPTFRLYRAVSYYKDTRLLPPGWDANAPEAAGIGPVGAEGDDDFVAGGDTVHLDVKVGRAGPYQVLVEVLYQPISARWASELFGVDLPETRAFKTLWDGLDRKPEEIGRTVVTVE